VPLGTQITADPRCLIQQGDFFALAASSEGFNLGQKFHAILLDIDHSPRNLLDPQNAAFYSPAGLAALSKHLHPGGIFAMWSDDPPDAEYLSLLQASFGTARSEIVSFPNPLLDKQSASTVYVARKAPSQ
jgi:spermidine synthase